MTEADLLNSSQMKPRRLSDAEFKRTFSEPMTRYVGPALIDIWPYVELVPANELEGHTVNEEFVDGVYVTADASHHHVLVMTRTSNVYLVVVVDVPAVRIEGHYLLDLNREYGLRAP